MGNYWWCRNKHQKPSRYTIYYCGMVTINMVPHHLGVVPWRTDVFLARYNEVWLLKGVKLPDKNQIIPPTDLSDSARRMWADGIARMVSERLTPERELHMMNEAQRRYCALVAALVNERCIKAATYGRRRSPKDYATGVSIEWSASDLLKPRSPTLRHALMTSLALALPADKATELIKLGAWLEYRIPVFSTESSSALYHNACWQLSRMCPTWHAESYLCDYTLLGSIEEIFRNQFNRVLGVANARELPVEDVAGCGVSYGVGEPEWRTDANQEGSFALEHQERIRLREEE